MKTLILFAILTINLTGCDGDYGPFSTASTEQARAFKCYDRSQHYKDKGVRGFDSTCEKIALHAEQLAAARQAKYERECRDKGLSFIGMVGDQIECR